MAVSVDTVYQKVLAIANKEQRGYITPQEFNLLADKAQLEIFETYFDDIKTSDMKVKHQMNYADSVEVIEERLNPFHVDTTVTTATASLTMPTMYRLIDVTRGGNKVTQVNKSEISYTENHPLTRATITRSVFVREDANTVTVYPAPAASTEFEVSYYKKPTSPNWGFVVTAEKALYDGSNSTDFELHVSEEENIVNRILQLSGVIMKQQDIQQAAMTDIQIAKQEKNN